jgi:hypothetical protein
MAIWHPDLVFREDHDRRIIDSPEVWLIVPILNEHYAAKHEHKGTKRHRRSISIDSTILLTCLLNACLNQAVVDRALQLALRGPEYIGDGVKSFSHLVVGR